MKKLIVVVSMVLLSGCSSHGNQNAVSGAGGAAEKSEQRPADITGSAAMTAPPDSAAQGK